MMMRSINKQQGAALIIITLVLVLTISSALLAGFDIKSQTISRDQQTINALSQAKQALINFALLSDQITGSPGVGYLPCPDQNGDGLSDEPCGVPGESSEGWLPWQTLGTKILRDSDHVCLRYVVSGYYKINPDTPLTKSPPTTGHFVIQDESNTVRVGSTPVEYGLAIIFAPHNIVAGQSRTIGAGPATKCGSNSPGAAVNLASNYLEQVNNVNNATGIYTGPGIPGDAALPTNIESVFILAERQLNFNDSVAWINPADFYDVYARMP